MWYIVTNEVINMNKSTKKLLIMSTSILLTASLTGCNNEPTVTQPVTYEVMFKNYDNSLLYQTSVEEGKDAVYVGDNPTRPDDGSYQYVFTGWDKPLTGITENTTFTAQFDKTNDFVVNFYTYDGTTLVLLQRDYVKSGDSVTYKGETPTKKPDFDYIYTFKGWDKAFDNVTSNLDVFATYDQTSNTKDFTIDFSFEVDQYAEKVDNSTANYIGENVGVDVSLKEPVVVDGVEYKTHHVLFDDMEFDYTGVDFNDYNSYEISISYGGVSKKDILNIVPNVDKWTMVAQADEQSSLETPAPNWEIMVYLDYYNEGLVVNTSRSKAYKYENVGDDYIRLYRSYDGVLADVIYKKYDMHRIGHYDFPDHEDVVATYDFVNTEDTESFNPTEFQLEIHQSLDEAPSAYGNAIYIDTYVHIHEEMAVKYDYDPETKSFIIHLPHFSRPFVYDESDGKYHN